MCLGMPRSMLDINSVCKVMGLFELSPDVFVLLDIQVVEVWLVVDPCECS